MTWESPSDGKLFAYPGRKGVHLLFATEEILDKLRPGLRPARLENGLAIAHRCWSIEQIARVKLAEEIERNHLVEHVGVVVGGVPDEMGKACVHAITRDPLIGKHLLIAFLEECVGVEAAGREVVHVE